MLNNRSILITGGTGSFGKEFKKTILERYPDVKRLVIFSRDELKQFEMQQVFPASQYPCLRYFIGDVRDEARLRRALEGIDERREIAVDAVDGYVHGLPSGFDEVDDGLDAVIGLDIRESDEFRRCHLRIGGRAVGRGGHLDGVRGCRLRATGAARAGCQAQCDGD